MIFEDLHRMLSIKFKQRRDSYFDQYTRLLAPKFLLVSSIIISINWFQDEVHCLVPSNVDMSADFVSNTCWINGLYIYQNMTNRTSKEVGYYGIPLDVSFDSLYRDGRPCSVVTRHGRVKPNYIPMEKIYYLQYQWFPFFIASLMILYFLSYTMLIIVNIDMVSKIRTYFKYLFFPALYTQTSKSNFCELAFKSQHLYLNFNKTCKTCER